VKQQYGICAVHGSERWAVIGRDVYKMQSVGMKCLCIFRLKTAVRQSHKEKV